MGSSSSERPGEVTCVLVDDHPSMLNALASLLESDGIAVVGRASTGAEAVALALQGSMVIVADARLADTSGLELAREILGVDPARGIVLYGGSITAVGVRAALDAGVRGIVFADSLLTSLSVAVRTVAAGGTHVDTQSPARARRQRAT
jgi:DNA-binding NarL/FixJ family response regulator